jgi:signal transduction histidine kinase
MRRLADERGVIIALDNRAALATIGADEHRMQQVLLVLLDNAIRYARPNGRITVTLETAPDGLSVRISDDGIGIHAGDLPFVFERFFRGRNAESSDRFGSGLGLPLAKAIVEAHAGKLTIESEHGVGTQAIIRLPGRFDARAVS